MAASAPAIPPVYQFSAPDIHGNVQSLSDYRGQVLLIVNIASKCGFTPQLKGLQILHQKFHSQGFSVLGFPCNQFAGQEPGTAEQIEHFCTTSYGVDFPLFSKIEVNGADAHPLYRYLTSEKRGVFGTAPVKWNFTKFLVDRHGGVISRFAPNTAPESLEIVVAQLIAEK